MMDISEFEKFIIKRRLTVEKSYEPEINDLYHLYSTVREKAVVSILEYGSGWSTLALTIGLWENKIEFGASHMASIRHPNPFQLMSIDASEHWQRVAIERLSKLEIELVKTVVATPRLQVMSEMICHVNDFVPNFSPDLIYLDGPDHDQITDQVNGFKYDEKFTQPMAADLLLLEHFLWPETIIITDGRTANARFLEKKFSRNWQVIHDPFGDRTTFRLNETPLGEISSAHTNFRLLQSKRIQSKESPALK